MKNVSWTRIVIGVVLGIIVLALLIQVVPYGRDHTNPPVVQEPQWDSQQTRELAVTACFDCHSNETNWDPWYTSVAPASWLVERDVQEGRERLNFSNWGANPRAERAGELGEVVLEGEMPPAQYLILHSAARLTDAEKQQLAQGLVATARQSQ